MRTSPARRRKRRRGITLRLCTSRLPRAAGKRCPSGPVRTSVSTYASLLTASCLPRPELTRRCPTRPKSRGTLPKRRSNGLPRESRRSRSPRGGWAVGRIEPGQRVNQPRRLRAAPFDLFSLGLVYYLGSEGYNREQEGPVWL